MRLRLINYVDEGAWNCNYKDVTYTKRDNSNQIFGAQSGEVGSKVSLTD